MQFQSIPRSPEAAAPAYLGRAGLAAPAPHASIGARSMRLAALGHALMQHLETPLVVADATGTVLESNPAATRRIERCEGLWLDASGRLAVRQGGRWVPISKWHAELVAGRTVTLALEADGPSMQLTLKPMAVQDAGFGSAT